jgi:predicted DNA-binding transcriptional regulator AlpA
MDTPICANVKRGVPIMVHTDDRFISREEVKRLTGMSRYLIDMLEGNGDFPKRIQVGQRRVYWSYEEVQQHLRDRRLRRSGANFDGPSGRND